MSEKNVAGSSNDEFLARLRGVTLSAPARDAAANLTLQNLKRTTDESNFSMDFLRYRSKIQRELGRGYETLSAAPSCDSNPVSESYKPVSESFNPVSEPYKPVSVSETEERKTVAEPASASNAFPRPSANPYDSVRPYSMVQPVYASVYAENTAPAVQQTQIIQESVTAKKSASVSEMKTNANNPFAQLLTPPVSQTSGNAAMQSAVPAQNSLLAPWLASARCFGVLGVLTGLGTVIFSIYSSAGTHNLTALGLSLLLSGVSMFAAAGILNGRNSL